MTPATAITRHAAALRELARLLTEASSMEYATPPRLSGPANDRVNGSGFADPTAATATNAARLALRQAIADAAPSLRSATVFLESATAPLERALTPYRGESVDAVLEDLAGASLAA